MFESVTRVADWELAFGLDAEDYHEVRLPYPDELYAELFARIPACSKGRGHGTGHALLTRDVSSVTATEPDPALAAFTARRLNDRRFSIVQASCNGLQAIRGAPLVRATSQPRMDAGKSEHERTM